MPAHTVTQFLTAFLDRAQKFCDMETDMLIQLDEQGRIEWFNPAFTKETGYTISDVLHTPISHLVVIDDWAIFFRSFTNINHPDFRLYHKGSGYVRAFTIRVDFDRDAEDVKRGVKTLLILRPV